MNNKYELLTDQTIKVFGHTLFRIKAKISFSDVKAGEFGGYIENEDNLETSGDAWVSGNAQVYGNARVSGDALVSGDAWVSGDAHYMTISPIGSRDDCITFMRTKTLEIYVSVGCFFGSIAEFRAKVQKTHGDNKHAKAYLLSADLAEIRIDLSKD